MIAMSIGTNLLIVAYLFMELALAIWAINRIVKLRASGTEWGMKQSRFWIVLFPVYVVLAAAAILSLVHQHAYV